MESSEADRRAEEAARRVVELSEEKDRAVVEQRYEAAARLRDECERLMDEVRQIGDAVLVGNVEREVASGGPAGAGDVVAELMAASEVRVDEGLLGEMMAAPLPVRWVIRGEVGSGVVVGTLRERLGVGSMRSSYYGAAVPVFSRETLGKGRNPVEWVRAMRKLAAVRRRAVVWVCEDLRWMEELGVLGLLLEGFAEESAEFVVCGREGEDGLVGRVTWLQSVVEVRAQ